MLSLIRIALARRYAFFVLAFTIFIFGILAIFKMPVDIFPAINTPIIAVAWQYNGMTPDQMSGRIALPFQRVLTTTVNNIEHTEAESINGYGIIKIFFQPGVNIAIANAQVTAIAQALLKQMPQGATPPFIFNYNASAVPILQLALTGKGLSEQQLGDLGLNILRPMLSAVPGAALPFPYGGKSRQVQIDMNSAALQARGLSAQDVANALASQQQINPIGTQKVGKYEYVIQLNNAATAVKDLENLPVKQVNGTVIYIRDIAHVRDGNPPQINVVHVDGTKASLIPVIKNGLTSTLAIIAQMKQKIIELKPALPENLVITPIGDQSLFVRASIHSVIREGAAAATLTSLLILLFLASWRSTLIICISIPLAVLGAIVSLSVLGETLNIMTLGGLALAVGILVDEATVTIENINWHLEQGKDVETAVMDGARQIIVPAFVSLLCICIVFVPMFFLQGVSRSLFVPMAEAVISAMVFSFLLSRTLVLTMAKLLLRPPLPQSNTTQDKPTIPSNKQSLLYWQRAFLAGFEHMRSRYVDVLSLTLANRRYFIPIFLVFILASFILVPHLGQNFFPEVDSGQILIHVRAPVGTRLEVTSEIFSAVERSIKDIIPSGEIDSMVDNIGLYIAPANMIYNNTGEIGEQDGDIQISLKEEHHPTEDLIHQLRERLPRDFPSCVFSFPPADIVSQILNFGSPAPIDVQIRGFNQTANFAYAQTLLHRIRQIPGIADARLQQSQSNPTFNVNVDRTRAQLLGITERDITNSLVANLSGTSQVQPINWLNPQNSVIYPISAQVPQYQLDSLSSLNNLPITSPNGSAPQVLGALASIERSHSNSVATQYNVQQRLDIYADKQRRDLGAVAADIQRAIDETVKAQPKGAKVFLLGQAETMNNTYSGLLLGLGAAIVLIYLLIVVTFDSLADPFVIITALPAALAGIVWILFASGTTLSVPALIGAIMCMGVATANSVLIVSFCRERLDIHGDAALAACEAGRARFRPVLMTALAMIIGMLPMALGWGSGGEENAPLGRAVIGGLLFATVATLLFVPTMFSIVHARSRDTDSNQLIGGPSHAT